MTNPRRWVRRATLSALGGGLTAASLSGPLSGWAFGANPLSGTGNTGATEGATAPAGAPEAAAPAGSQQPTTTTSTPPAAPSVPQASTPAAPAAPNVPEAPPVVVQRRQRTTKSAGANPATTPTHPKPATPAAGGTKAPKPAVATGPSNVALAPQIVAAEAAALAAEFAGSAASAQALSFYRIPLFLLPIYQAAAVQYGVPWQILAAINEIETNYGLDQSVSTAGAVGWMQFMPATWMQYGVDALNAGYADPYNPVDAIFAAARYLRAAGAASNLHTAIFAYNHSEEYVSSVFLRAKLISTYPKPVIATLTGLIDDRLPVTGAQLAWGSLPPAVSPSSATGNATAVPGTPPASADRGSTGAAAPTGTSASAQQGSSMPAAPAAAAPVAAGQAALKPQPPQLVDLMSAPNASVVAVQDGRIVQIGKSRALGNYVVLRDVYGDVFTYASLGSIAPSYRLPKESQGGRTSVKAPVAGAAAIRDPAPAEPATAGHQGPLTLRVQRPGPQTAPTQASVPAGSAESVPAGMGKTRLFAHPGNPDALAAAAASAAQRAVARPGAPDRPLALRAGSVVAKGTVLGHVRTPPGAKQGHLRFAIRPANDLNTIDPRPILANWVQLDTALHPKGATGENHLLGATASDVFLFSKGQLERDILADPGIVMSACSRQEVASGKIDKRVLAVLAFLSRSGLKPTVGTLQCGRGAYAVSGYLARTHTGDAIAISKINGVPIAAHQGAASITDLTIRTLLTLQGEFVPNQIVSLMKYPGAPSTLARPDHGDYIEVVFPPAPKRAPGRPSAAATAAGANSAGVGQTASSPLAVGGNLTTAQWNQLFAHIAALPTPVVSAKPSPSAIPDRQAPAATAKHP
jgi:soluble lytic murein transglycosylase-like protein